MRERSNEGAGPPVLGFMDAFSLRAILIVVVMIVLCL